MGTETLAPEPLRAVLLVRIIRQAGFKVRLEGSEVRVRGSLNDPQAAFIREHRDLIALGVAIEEFEPQSFWIQRPPGGTPPGPPAQDARPCSYGGAGGTSKGAAL